MGIQIIATPLTSDTDLIVECDRIFSQIDHHSPNKVSPYDIYILTTTEGLRFEALLQLGSLHIELSSRDLSNRPLQESVYELGRSAACVIWSDEGPVAAVADREFIQPAATKLGFEPEIIEHVANPDKLFEALFGPEE
ncbi:MAG: hypothetical protein ABJF50_09090 [Paracoccaceae bacterium]|uniref:hypothetical protein n=1 Tax=Yoonia sp. TaxID=2212373 RepID=UPI00327C1333